uniref:RNA polymerase sigma factor n=1 Tax=Ningiella ruwaisensis TaxID=2364274 RepID=UPI00109FC1D0|nr:sigma-70 family RNA polymerase sigma factor [Ningiella ruwaisensis]
MSEYKGFGQAIDASVITKAQNGERAAMEVIYLSYSKPCYQMAMRLTANPQASQDIVHEVFLKVLKKIKQFELLGSFSGWVRKIALNEAVDYIKRNSRSNAETETVDELISTHHYFEHQWWESIRDLEKLTAKLSPNARAVLFLHEVEGLTHSEIAHLFDKSERFSKQMLFRALAQLKAMSAIKELKNASD